MYGCTGRKRTLDKIKGCFLYSDTGGDAECTFHIFLVCVVFGTTIKKSFLSALSTVGWWGERTSIHKENKPAYRWLIKHRKCGIQCRLRCFWPWQNQFWCIWAAFCYLFNFPGVLSWHIIWNTSETCAPEVLDGGWINPLSVICKPIRFFIVNWARSSSLRLVTSAQGDIRHAPSFSKRIKSKIKWNIFFHPKHRPILVKLPLQ